jgi:hypothetical protein
MRRPVEHPFLNADFGGEIPREARVEETAPGKSASKRLHQVRIKAPEIAGRESEIAEIRPKP